MSTTYRVELHSHTTRSHDGNMRFAAAMRMAKRRALDAIAVTDHDCIEGAIEFKARADRAESHVKVIVGEERTLRDGSHIIGLFLRKEIVSDSAPDCIAEIRAQGGIAVIPHPYRRKDGLFAKFPAPLEGVCFEIFNPKCSHQENLLAQQNLPPGCIAVAGSDAHYEADLGEAVNIIPSIGSVEHSIRAALTGANALIAVGVTQTRHPHGRSYAPLYYRLRPYVRLPKRLVPPGKYLYRCYRNLSQLHQPALEVKHATRENPS
jgi:predicted metal-dependent phosphoesterase TrpH